MVTKKKIAYISTPKCGSNSIMAALKQVSPFIAFDVSGNQRLRDYEPEISEIIAQKHDYSAKNIFNDIPQQVENGAICMVPFYKFPFHCNGFRGENGYSLPSFVDYTTQGGIETWHPASILTTKIFTNEFYTWTVVRNPWDRLASAYFYLKHRSNIKDIETQLENVAFDEFVKVAIDPLGWIRHICSHNESDLLRFSYLGSHMGEMEINTLNRVSSLTFNPPYINRQFVVNHFTELFPTERSMHTCNRAIFTHTQRWEDSQLFSGYMCYELSKDRQVIVGVSPVKAEALDKVIRFENLQEGFDELLEELGLPHVDLPFKNQGPYTNNASKYRDIYTPETIELVRNHYKYEIETFGYEFGK